MEIDRDDDDAGKIFESGKEIIHSVFKESIQRYRSSLFWRQRGNVEGSFKMKAANLPKDFD